MARTKKAPEQPNPKSTNGWDLAVWFLGRLFSAGYAAPILALAGVASIVWVMLRGLESADQKELLLVLFASLKLSYLGWFLFFMTIIIAAPLFRWMSHSNQKEIERQREIIERLLPSPNDTFSLKNDPQK